MDDLDRASEWDERNRAEALEAWRQRQRTGPGRATCVDCEEEIPEARRQAVPHCVRCIECQEVFERR